jgi:CDP-glucose 4,6-dehydratase
MHFSDIYAGKTVCVTGHTGFKGSWLCEWLLLCGARVIGVSSNVPTTPSHFQELDLEKRLTASLQIDIRSQHAIKQVLEIYQPDFIFHLAAQPLVYVSYDDPHMTIDTNVMGSLNLLEAVRCVQHDCIVIMITSDKVYENREWVYAYRENDPVGGHDPYSASKACAELIIASYQRSFFQQSWQSASHANIAVASARGGNVIGGGDWTPGRIVPECMRHLHARQPIPVRQKTATRPWQGVLDLLSGYLLLGAEIYDAFYSAAAPDRSRLQDLSSSFNFGPLMTSHQSVQTLVEAILRYWPGQWQDDTPASTTKHEANRLHLSIDKAYHLLKWQPRWSFDETVRYTVAWYQAYYHTACGISSRVQELTREHIRAYELAGNVAPYKLV